MLPVIAEPRKEISKYAPKIITSRISVDKIKDNLIRFKTKKKIWYCILQKNLDYVQKVT